MKHRLSSSSALSRAMRNGPRPGSRGRRSGGLRLLKAINDTQAHVQQGPGRTPAGLRTKRVWICALCVTKMRWLTSSSRARCRERHTYPSATMLEPYTLTDTPPTSSEGGRWCCWRDDSPRRRHSPECGRGILRTSPLRSSQEVRIIFRRREPPGASCRPVRLRAIPRE